MQLPNLTIEDIKALAQLERDMDSGKQAFVVNERRQCFAFPFEVLAKADVISGQTVSDALLTALMRLNIEHVIEKLAESNVDEFQQTEIE